ASRANCGSRTLIATVRPNTGSNPRKTSAIPPAPIRASTRYRSARIESFTLVRSPPEECLDHLLGDRRGDAAAGGLVPEAAAVQHDNRYRDARRLRGARGCERGEPR